MPTDRPYLPLGTMIAEMRGRETQQAAAARLGISRTYLTEIETGVELPSAAMLYRLVSAFGAAARQSEADAVLLRLLRERDAKRSDKPAGDAA